MASCVALSIEASGGKNFENLCWTKSLFIRSRKKSAM